MPPICLSMCSISRINMASYVPLSEAAAPKRALNVRMISLTWSEAFGAEKRCVDKSKLHDFLSFILLRASNDLSPYKSPCISA